MTTSEPHRQLPVSDTAPLSAANGRIASLDFIRGLAVMGILAANIVAFGQPMTAYFYPDAFTVPHTATDDWLWVAQFVLVDGKMRGLFTLLFGAGMVLFMERAWAAGATRWLQVRRLLWLGLFGIIHFVFIWQGDILLGYAINGLVAVLFLRWPQRALLICAAALYLAGAAGYMKMVEPYVAYADQAESAPQSLADQKAEELSDGVLETGLIAQGRYDELVTHNLAVHSDSMWFFPILFGPETLPLMLMGMALFRMGLFSGELDPGRQRLWGWTALLAGGAASLAIALWVKAAGFTYYATAAAFLGLSSLPRLAMTLGLAALLALWGGHARGWLAERVSAAGRAAFTNYLGTSILMMLVFHGWALGLFGVLGRGQLYLVVLAVWALMLLWSKPWLARFRFGPLEWLWRCLTYWHLYPLRR